MRFKGLDLNLLVVLDCLLEEGSVSKAANRMYVTQPAMSSALKRLREFFNDELLVLDGRKMMPTSRAISLRAEVKELLAQAERVLATGQDFDPKTARQCFRIAASDYQITVSFSAMLERLRDEAPGTAIEFFSPSDAAYAAFEQGEMDLIVGPEALVLPDHPTSLLYEESQVVIGWAGNPIFVDHLTMERFTTAEHVAVQIGSGSRNSLAEAYLRKLPVNRTVAVTANSFSVVPSLLIGTDRLAVLHSRLAEWYSRYFPIASVPMPFDFPKSRMVVQYHRRRGEDASLQWLLDRLQQAVDSFWLQDGHSIDQNSPRVEPAG